MGVQSVFKRKKGNAHFSCGQPNHQTQSGIAQSCFRTSKCCLSLQDDGRVERRFYRHQELGETDGLEGLITCELRVPNLKNRVYEGTEQAFFIPAVEFLYMASTVEQHDYPLYLAINDIDHAKTKTMSHQADGICERFHKIIVQELYQVALRKKLYADLESLQKNLARGLMIAIMKSLIRVRFARAECHWELYSVADWFGMQNSKTCLI